MTTEAATTCPKCGRQATPGKRFCAGCGTSLLSTCTSCGARLSPEDRFCEDCGAPFQATGAAPAAAPPTAALPRRPSAMEERRLATVLFADLAGYTSLTERLDPEDVRAIQSLYFEAMSAEITRLEGTIEKYAGDAILALFGVPVAHEDDAERAVRCAINMHDALRTVATVARARWGVDLAMRIGVNTGEVVSGTWAIGDRKEHAVSGDAVNVAARLQSAAEPGEVLVAADSKRLAERGIEFGTPRDLTLKGKASTVRAYPVNGERQRRIERWERSGETARLIGRDQELGVLKGYFERARAGEGQVVFVGGEAGIGKSRLLVEFRRSIEAESARWVEGHCISYGKNMPYLPLIDAVKEAFDIPEGEPEEGIIQRIEAATKAWDEPARAALPYLKFLLNVNPGDPTIAAMDPMKRRAGLLDAVRWFIIQESAKAPLVLVVEDLHWTDENSQDAIRALADVVAGRPVLLILTYRPGYTNTLGDREHFNRLSLDHLRAEESGELATALLGVNSLPREVRELILSKAEGNPFYIEEVTKSLVELGYVARLNGTYTLTRPVDEIYIPDTIQEIILSRIDRLQRDEKEAIQVASVIGREFTLRLLHRISAVEAGLDGVLSELKLLELIYEKSYFPELAYMFKHALTHDVAYSTLLLERRRALHHIVAAAVEELYAERLPEQYEMLAYHYSYAEEWEKALHYLLLAAEKATAAYANHDAIAYYDRSLWVIGRLGNVPVETMMRVYGGKAGVAFTTSRSDDMAENYTHLREVAAQAGNRVVEGLALGGVAFGEFLSHRFDRAAAAAHEALAIADELDSNAVRTGALFDLGFLDAVCGRLSQAAGECVEAQTYGRETEQSTYEIFAGAILSLIYSWQAHYADAIGVAEDSLRRAEGYQLPVPWLATVWTLALSKAGAGSYQEAIDLLEPGIREAQRFGERDYQARSLNTLGWVYGELGDYQRAIDFNRRGLTLALEAGDPEMRVNAEINLADYAHATGQDDVARRELETLYASLPELHEWMKWRYAQHITHSLGEVMLRDGDSERALALADECLALALPTETRKNIVKAHRLRAEVFVAQGRTEDAEIEASLALDVAREAGNPPQLWKALALSGDIQARQGRTDESQTAYREALGVIQQVTARLRDDALRQKLLALPLVQRLNQAVAV